MRKTKREYAIKIAVILLVCICGYYGFKKYAISVKDEHCFTTQISSRIFDFNTFTVAVDSMLDRNEFRVVNKNSGNTIFTNGSSKKGIQNNYGHRIFTVYHNGIKIYEFGHFVHNNWVTNDYKLRLSKENNTIVTTVAITGKNASYADFFINNFQTTSVTKQQLLPTTKNEIENEAIIAEPSKPFIALVKYMDSCSYTLDTVSMQDPLKQFDEIAVYSMVYANTSLHQLLTNPEEYADGSIGNISVPYTADYDKTFAEVQQIWLYPWHIATTTEGLKRKGVVEEWSFATQEQAKEAYNFLIKEQDYLGFPYIKTAVYYVQCGTYLYVLHSNHSGVAYRHKKFAAYLENQCENIQNNSE